MIGGYYLYIDLVSAFVLINVLINDLSVYNRLQIAWRKQFVDIILMAEKMKEEFLQYIWKMGLYRRDEMCCSDGSTVEVLHPGYQNKSDSGPDFEQARLRIDGILWVGAVEIHILASDWVAHKHNWDPAYDQVILHVVRVEDQKLRRSNGSLLPCLILERRIQAGIHHKFMALIQNANT